MCFLIDCNELYYVRVKEIQKNAALAFYCVLSKIGLKSGKFPIFWKKRAYFKKSSQRFSRARMVLKT